GAVEFAFREMQAFCAPDPGRAYARLRLGRRAGGIDARDATARTGRAAEAGRGAAQGPAQGAAATQRCAAAAPASGSPEHAAAAGPATHATGTPCAGRARSAFRHLATAGTS